MPICLRCGGGNDVVVKFNLPSKYVCKGCVHARVSTSRVRHR